MEVITIGGRMESVAAILIAVVAVALVVLALVVVVGVGWFIQSFL